MGVEKIRTKLGEIEYSITGKGMPILFLHGGHSNCHDSLCRKGLDLSKYRLITPSRPGYGGTPLANNKTPLQAAALIVELLNYLAVDKVIVYGVSAGGLTAIGLAQAWPDRVSKLILASAVSTHWLDKDSRLYKMARIIFSPSLEHFTWFMVRFLSRISPKMLARVFQPQFSSRPLQELDDTDVSELVDTLKSYRSGMGFLNDIEQAIAPDKVGKISCPTLVIHSKNDNSVSIDHAYSAHERIQSSRLEIVDNQWGHLLWLGADSRQSSKIIADFVEQHASKT